MKGRNKFVDEAGRRKEQICSREPDFDAETKMDEALAEALGDFRLCVQTWSDSVLNRPRKALAEAPRGRVWRLAAGWTFACLLLAVAVSGGIYQLGRVRHPAPEMAHRQAPPITAPVAVDKAVPTPITEQDVTSEAKPASKEEDLMTSVDADIAQSVPDALQSLVQLMAEDGTQ
jgi:hypothetical protein